MTVVAPPPRPTPSFPRLVCLWLAGDWRGADGGRIHGGADGPHRERRASAVSRTGGTGQPHRRLRGESSAHVRKGAIAGIPCWAE